MIAPPLRLGGGEDLHRVRQLDLEQIVEIVGQADGFRAQGRHARFVELRQ